MRAIQVQEKINLTFRMKTNQYKLALITGASSGIGTAYAEKLAANNINLVLTARSTDKLEELSQKLEAEYAIKAYVISQDLSDPGAAKQLYENCQKQKLHVDLLINNAGFGYQGFFEKSELAFYTNMLNLNITALTELTYLFGKDMLDNGLGAVQNIASVAGVQPIPYFSVYAASKSYVIDFSLALWREWKDRGVLVSVMCPGPVETRFFEVSGANPREMMLRKLQTPEDVAEIGWKAILKKKPEVFSSRSLSLTAGFATKLPAKWVASVINATMKPKANL